MKIDRRASVGALRHCLLRRGSLSHALIGCGVLLGIVSCKSANLGLSSHTASTFVAAPRAEPAGNSPLLPRDPAVSTGKLDNGLTYLVRRHSNRERRAHLVLAVRAGSVVEGDGERGLAHFVEHMAFEGTARFPRARLSKFMTELGMKEQADENATTLFDSTVYRLSVPTDDPQLLGQALDLLRDFAQGVVFDQASVDGMRHELLSELQGQSSSLKSIARQRMRMLLKGSRYLDRDIRGLPTSVVGASTQDLKDFYRRWYRPDQLAVVLVGDFEAGEAAEAIGSRFSSLQSPAKPVERPRYSVPLVPGTHVARLSNAKQPYGMAQIALKLFPTEFRTEADYRMRLIRQMIVQMLGKRLRIAAKDPASPFKTAAMMLQPGFLEAFDLVQITSEVGEGQQYNALHALLIELKRAEVHGFLPSESKRVKISLLRRLDGEVLGESTTSGEALATELAQSFLTGDAVPGPDIERALGERILAEITLAELNAEYRQWINKSERYVIAAGADEISLPERGSLLGAVNEVLRYDVSPYRDLAADGQLMARLPLPGTIVKERFFDGIGVHEWTLSNGAKVVFKPSASEPGKVVEQSISAGGTSTVSDRHFASARFAQQVVNVGGLGEYDVAQLGKVLSGKELLVSPWVSDYQEGIRASAATQDFESMLQLMHLFFTSPRRDEAAFNGFRRQLFNNLAARETNPPAVLIDTIERRSWQPSVRHSPPRPEAVKDINLDVAMKFYVQRFGNVSDFTFVFVGDVEVSRMRALAEMYLASLPGVDRDDTYVDRKERRRGEVVKVRVRGGQQAKSRVSITYHGDKPWSPQSEVELQALRGYLELRLRDALSRTLGGISGSLVWTNHERIPYEHYAFGFEFDCKPEDTDGLRKVAFAVVEDVKRNGVGVAYIEKLKIQGSLQYEKAFSNNRFWLEQLAASYSFGDNPESIPEISDNLQALTGARLQEVAQQYLLTNQYIDALLVPDLRPLPDDKAAAPPVKAAPAPSPSAQ